MGYQKEKALTSGRSNAGKAAKKVPQGQRRSPFVDFQLTKEQSDACKAYVLDGLKTDNCLAGLFDSGYKLSMRYDDYNECAAAWLIAPDDHVENAGLILAGRGSTPMRALRQVLFIHFEIFDGGAWPTRDENRRLMLDD